MVTPFTDEDGVDFAALDKLIEHVISGGADYLVALGTTAETPALSGSEKEAILRFVVERNAGRVPVIAASEAIRRPMSFRPSVRRISTGSMPCCR